MTDARPLPLPESPCFFVLGYGRSGTTLLRRMLSAHPRLFVPPENDIFQRLPPVIGRGGVRDEAALSRVIKAFPPYYARIYDIERFRHEVTRRLPMPPEALFTALIGCARIADGKPRDALWGHKMPSEWPYIGQWRRWYPEARFLHLVRQPHDATASMVQYQLQRYPTGALVGAWQWRKAFRAIRRHGRELAPNRYLMLRYEDLVANPETVLGQVCRFLGVEETALARMINYKNDPSGIHTDEGEHMQRTQGALTAERIGRSENYYNNNQAAMLDYLCRNELTELGYEPRTGRPLSRPHRLAADLACGSLDLAWQGLRGGRRLQGQL